jgi:hypothetical protein
MLGLKKSPAEPAGVASQGDARLDRAKPAGTQFVVTGAEGLTALAQTRGDPHQALRCSARPWRLMRPRRVIVEDW